MSQKVIRFSAIDSLFFRESRPMESMGELQSLFPPSMQTLTGAVRTWIGEQQQVNWQDFKNSEDHFLRKIIGDPSKTDDLGVLHFNGVWLSRCEKRLYPVPLYLMKKDNELFQLCLSEQGHYCDLGKKVRLPQFSEEEAKGSKPLENTWITADTLITLLQGEQVTYKKDDFIHIDDLITKESRVGIARNNQTRVVKEGMLYQTQHIRPRHKVSFEVDVTGLEDDFEDNNNSATQDEISHQTKHIIRLGGEGRSASLSIETKTDTHHLPKITVPDDEASKRCIMLYLLTPLLIQQEEDSQIWQPLPHFKKVEVTDQTTNKTTYWKGTINNITLKLHGAVTGKTIRQGGWNLANHQPRRVQSYIPAGSVFYCEIVTDNKVNDNNTVDINTVIGALHNQQIGEKQTYGYGQIAVGLWKETATNNR